MVESMLYQIVKLSSISGIRGGNVSDVLLKFQQPDNQYNTKELPYYFLLLTIEKRVFQAYNVL